MGKIKDLTGQKFGELTVISFVERKNRMTYWECECSCGKIKKYIGTNLTSGKTTSCGHSFIDITNMRFGKLTAVEKTDSKNSSGSIFWKCKCDCGNIVRVAGTALRAGRAKSCGKCIPNIINKKFNKLTVLELLKESNGKRRKYLCKCECGNFTEVQENNLLNGHTQSCGCIKSKGEEYISILLRENNINFISQKRIDISNKKFYFDFFVENYYFIEFDGIQHFNIEHRGWNNEENYEKLHQRDLIKNEYCFSNNIPLIRIPYTKLQSLTLKDLLLESSKYLVNGGNKYE